VDGFKLFFAKPPKTPEYFCLNLIAQPNRTKNKDMRAKKIVTQTGTTPEIFTLIWKWVISS
jgi:hypothetical protein